MPPGGTVQAKGDPKAEASAGRDARQREATALGVQHTGPPGARGPTGREHLGRVRVAIEERRRPGSERSGRRGTRQAPRRWVLLQRGGCGPSPARLP